MVIEAVECCYHSERNTSQRIMGTSSSYRAKFFLLAVLLLCSIVFVAATWQWPLAGDGALIHYIAFLSAHGYRPYLSIDDINLPAALLPDFIVQSLFGPSALAWRIYDLILLILIGVGFWQIANKRSRFAALWAALLFALIHGRDGVEQTGQRDLAATPLLLFAIAAIQRGYEEELPHLWLIAGVLCALAASIKPTLIFFLAVPLLFLLVTPGIRMRCCLSSVGSFFGGALLAFGVQAGWLASIGALSTFLEAEEYRAPFHMRLGNASAATLLHHSMSPISFLVVLALILVLASRNQRNRASSHNLLLLLACCASFLSFLLQRKAFAYHRYPLLAFLLLFAALEFVDRAKSADWRACVAWTGLAWSALVLAPLSVWKAAHYEDPEQEVVAQLKVDLENASHTERLAHLSGNVQCIDSVNGCIETLERSQLVQETGHIYDEFFFNPSTAYTADYRSKFLTSLVQRPPAIVVVMANLFPDGPGNYAKLNTWPEFNTWLSHNYILFVQRDPRKPVQNIGGKYLPPGYRVYIHNIGQ